MSISLPGTVALIGAGEYLPPIATVDKALLERVGDTPRVVVLPTAAAPDGPGIPERWAQMLTSIGFLTVSAGRYPRSTFLSFATLLLLLRFLLLHR